MKNLLCAAKEKETLFTTTKDSVIQISHGNSDLTTAAASVNQRLTPTLSSFKSKGLAFNAIIGEFANLSSPKPVTKSSKQPLSELMKGLTEKRFVMQHTQSMK